MLASGLNVEVSGSGQPVVLVHGFLGRNDTWRPLIDALSENMTVAVDLPGHGASPAPSNPDEYGPDAQVERLGAVLESLGLKRFAIVGYSMGGRLALLYALRHRHQVVALVLESASPGLDDAEARDRRRAQDDRFATAIESGSMEEFVSLWEDLPMFASQRLLDEPTRAWVRRTRLETHPVAAAATIRRMSPGAISPLWDTLSGLDIPTLLVAGALDRHYVSIMKRAATSLPRAEIAVVPGAGHAVHIEQPHAFNHRVKEFLERNYMKATEGDAHARLAV